MRKQRIEIHYPGQAENKIQPLLDEGWIVMSVTAGVVAHGVGTYCFILEKDK